MSNMNPRQRAELIKLFAEIEEAEGLYVAARTKEDEEDCFKRLACLRSCESDIRAGIY